MKQKILEYYKQLVQDRIDVYKDMIESLSSDAQNDAKSSAGDKHETALSMMHLEQEKLNFKLSEAIEHLQILNTIDSSKTTTKVTFGSLVKVNDLTLFISVALPKIVIEGVTVFAVSPESPLSKQLINNTVGFSFNFNNKEYFISYIE